MKRKLLSNLLLLGIVTTIGFTSCSSDDSSDKEEKSRTEDRDRDTQDDSTEDSEEDTEASNEDSENNETDSDDTIDSITPLSIQTGQVNDQEWYETYQQTLAYVSYPIINLGNDSRNEYPQLAQALEDLSEEKKTTQLQDYNDILETALEEISYNPDYFSSYETTESVMVRRADSRITSLLFEGYYYSGGAHGYSYYLAETYDSQTGKRLELDDVVTDIDALPELIKEQLLTYYDSVQFYGDLDLSDYFTNNDITITWTLDYNGISFYFSPYEIADYASGRQNVTISFAEHPELFKEEYTEIPESHGMELSLSTPVYYDLDNDGQLDEIYISGTGSEYYDYEQLTISINGQDSQHSIESFRVDPVLVHTADDKTFLYVETTVENDSDSITVYNLTNGHVREVNSIYMGFQSTYIEDENYYSLKNVLTNPDNFALDTYTSLLSTLYGHAYFSTGANGMPVTDDTWYVFNKPLELTLLQPLEIDIIEEESGKVTNTTTLQKGTKVTYFRTDDETIADLRLPNGSIGRVTLNKTDWPKEINSIPIEELFDGLIFAG